MYTKEDLHKLISGAHEGWLPGDGQVFTVCMTPKQRESLLEFLVPTRLAEPICVDADGKVL